MTTTDRVVVTSVDTGGVLSFGSMGLGRLGGVVVAWVAGVGARVGPEPPLRAGVFDDSLSAIVVST